MHPAELATYKGYAKVLGKRRLTGDTVLLRIERKDIIFRAGQYLVVGTHDGKYRREYSFFSGEGEPYIDLLIKVVPHGNVSSELSEVSDGQEVYVEGPYGSFGLETSQWKNERYVFIATGTGIAPFHSFIKSHSPLDYSILHGIRYHHETFGKESFDSRRYISCTSRDQQGHFHGRVTDYLDRHGVDKNCLYYLCGNGAMIYDVNELLIRQGILSAQIRTEVYF
jgi:ferredoxin/flavodoxin---NADP+ reductase